jgi:hypothetical protein
MKNKIVSCVISFISAKVENKGTLGHVLYLQKHLGGVHVAAWTAINDDYLFHFLLCSNLFDYSAWIADSHHI